MYYNCMRKIIGLLLVCAFCISVNATGRKEYTLKKGWKFTKGEVVEGWKENLDVSKWHDVVAPMTGRYTARSVSITINRRWRLSRMDRKRL